MKIEYEVGDVVFRAEEYGGHTFTVTAVRQNGVAVRDEYGETFFLGKHRVEPHPGTVKKALWIRPGGSRA